MTKQAFLARLSEGLSGLPQEDVRERLTFFDEMIDDRMEEGLSEEAAVAAVGPVEEIVAQTVAEIPLPRLVRERMQKGRALRGWEIALLILGAPLWLPLLIAGGAVLLSVYILIWSLILALWAAELSLAVSALACLGGSLFFLLRGDSFRGLLALSAGLMLSGLSVFFFFLCKALTAGAARLTKRIALGIKNLFVGRRNTQ